MNAPRSAQPHAFAPGAIEHHRRPLATPAQWRALATWAQRTAALLAIVCLIAFTAGYLTVATAA